MRDLLQKIFKLLTGRVARNIYLWTFMLYTVFNINVNNERAYHYGVIRSPWYYPFMIAGIILQAALLYGNNLLLVPRLLAQKKYFRYCLAAFTLTLVISLIYTFGLKLALPYMNVNKLQQVGFVSSPVTNIWTWDMLFSEMTTYLFGNIMWVFIFTMAWYMNDYGRQQKMAEQARRQQVETELYFLKNQLNPHFLFNTLNNLYALTLKKSDSAPDSILKLSSILRYLLYESNTARVSFKREQEVLLDYIDLELLRLKNKEVLQVKIDTDKDYYVPPLLWLPVLENVFKHGTRIIDNHQIAYFTLSIQNGRMHIYSKNLCKPYTAKGDKGIGLNNLRKRLELLYPGNFSLMGAANGDEYITEVIIEHI